MSKIAIIGAGNLGLAIAEGIVGKGLRQAQDVTLTRRHLSSIQAYGDKGYALTTSNVEAAKSSKWIFLCVQPSQLEGVLKELNSALTEDHVLVSVITGVSIEEIGAPLQVSPAIVRAMPNTAIAIGESMTCLAVSNGTEAAIVEEVQEMFQALGQSLANRRALDESRYRFRRQRHCIFSSLLTSGHGRWRANGFLRRKKHSKSRSRRRKGQPVCYCNRTNILK